MQSQHPRGDGRWRKDGIYIFIYLFVYFSNDVSTRQGMRGFIIMGRKTEVQEVRRCFRLNVNGEASKLRKRNFYKPIWLRPLEVELSIALFTL